MISGDGAGDGLFLVTVLEGNQDVEISIECRCTVTRHQFGVDAMKNISNIMAVTVVTVFPPTGRRRASPPHPRSE
jgi:hypothetical protein